MTAPPTPIAPRGVLDPTRPFQSRPLLAASSQPPVPAPRPSAAPVPSVPHVPESNAAPAAARAMRQFEQSEKREKNVGAPPPIHWVWSVLAFGTLAFLAINAATLGSSPSGQAEFWRLSAVIGVFLAAALTVSLLSLTNYGFPLVLFAFPLLGLAWLAPFMALGFFSGGDDAAWYLARVPWWSLISLAFILKALETRGPRRRFTVRALLFLQGIQVFSYALLLLMSIFYLGRSGGVSAMWALIVTSLLGAWFIQARSLRTMWTRTEPNLDQPGIFAPFWRTLS